MEGKGHGQISGTFWKSLWRDSQCLGQDLNVGTTTQDCYTLDHDI
jgi:hypothetical protein